MRILFLLLLLGLVHPLSASEKKLKVLHLCFHIGCVREIEGVAQALSIDLTSWNIHDLPPFFFDEVGEGNCLYNIGHDRAQRIWRKHRHFFNQFDVIITSDTAPLSRIFLQNGWKKPLIIWVSNRFDWHAGGENLDCHFPDEEYYDLMRQASQSSNVFLVASTPYEIYYAKKKNVDIGNRIIKACACYLSEPREKGTASEIYIHQRTDNVQADNLQGFSFSQFVREVGIPTACYRYDSVEALQELGRFKGVLYLPYQWYAISLFETLQLQLPTFVPSERMLTALIKKASYFFDHSDELLHERLFALTEWYNPEVRNLFIYFDNWEDLRLKAQQDLSAVRRRMADYALKHRQEMLQRWKEVFDLAALYESSHK